MIFRRTDSREGEQIDKDKIYILIYRQSFVSPEVQVRRLKKNLTEAHFPSDSIKYKLAQARFPTV